ncbi:MAG: PAS domain S-box protein [Cyanobacteria bacterium J06627_32]
MSSSSSSSKANLKPAKKLNLLVQNSPLAMIEWDSDFMVVTWNSAAAELFSFFEDEAVGRRLDELMGQRQVADLSLESWLACDRAGVLREHVGIEGKRLCRWFNTPFTVRGQRVGTLSTVVNLTEMGVTGRDIAGRYESANAELRSHLQSRTQMLRHTITRLQSAMAERAQTHAALDESEARFKTMAANVPGVLYQFCLKADGSYRLPYISAACEEIYELSAPAAQADPDRLLAMINADDRLGLEVSMRQSAETLSAWHSEHRLTLPSGQHKWVQMASRPQALENGDILWSGVVMDITDSKQANHRLQSAHTFLNNLVNGLADPIFVKDKDHRLILANDAFCEFVGRSRDALIGKTDDEFMPPDEASTVWQQDEHVLSSGQPRIFEDFFTDNRDRRKFVSTTKSRFYTLEDSPYLLGTMRDLTEQMIAQKALKENEKRLKKLTANIPGMLYQFHLSADLKPSFWFVSANYEALLGLSVNEIKADATALLDKIHPDDRAQFDQSVAASAQTLQDWHWQGRLLCQGERTVWFQAISRPERLPDNSILWDGLLIDITMLKQTEANLQKSEGQLRSQTQQLKDTLKKLKHTQAKLIQSEKMSSLGQLVGGIAHEINNPVSFIHGNVTHVRRYTQDMLTLIRLYQAHHPTPHPEIQTLNEELELDYVAKDLPKLLDSVQQGTERIRNIVLSLRNFSRLDESGLKRTDLHEGLENTLMLLGKRLKETVTRPAIEVVKAYEHIPRVDCYTGQLNQVFMNILANAVDAIDDAAATAVAEGKAKAFAAPEDLPRIAIHTYPQAGRIIIQIMNNGSPISPQIQNRMFDPFFTTKAVGKGTGMGLSISYQTVVGLHKGLLEYSQTADGKTTFTIELPATQVDEP